MKYIFLFITLYTVSSFAKPPKDGASRVAITCSSTEMMYKDTTTYLHYLDSIIHTKKFCFTSDTSVLFPGGVVEAGIPAQYPGGSVELIKFLAKTSMYPAWAREKNIQGKVLIRIIVDEDGNICNPRIIKFLGYCLDEEAIRVMELMSKWDPAILNGKHVKQAFYIPINFKLQ